MPSLCSREPQFRGETHVDVNSIVLVQKGETIYFVRGYYCEVIRLQENQWSRLFFNTIIELYSGVDELPSHTAYPSILVPREGEPVEAESLQQCRARVAELCLAWVHQDDSSKLKIHDNTNHEDIPMYLSFIKKFLLLVQRSSPTALRLAFTDKNLAAGYTIDSSTLTLCITASNLHSVQRLGMQSTLSLCDSIGSVRLTFRNRQQEVERRCTVGLAKRLYSRSGR